MTDKRHSGDFYRVAGAVFFTAVTSFFAWVAVRASDERQFLGGLGMALFFGILTAIFVYQAVRDRGQEFRPGGVHLQPLILQQSVPADASGIVTIAMGADPFQLTAAVEALRDEGFEAALLEQEGSALLGFIGVQMRVVVPGHQARAAHAFLQTFVSAFV
jgi:hypothetical protein